MARFIYKAKEGPDHVREGELEAANLKEAVARVGQMGYIPVDIREGQGLTSRIPLPLFRRISFTRIGQNEKVVFLRQLYDFVDAEIPILRAIQLIIEQTHNLNFQSVLKEIRQAIENGEALSSALSRHKDLFPSYMVAMIRAGEISGRLKGVLKHLCELAEQQEEMAKRITGSLVYPAIIMGVGILTVFVLLTFVIPRLAVMFEDLDQQLPMVTQVLIGIGQFLSKFWWIPVGLIVAVVLFIRKRCATVEGKLFFDRRLLEWPLIGRLIKTQELERVARTLAIMLENGVEIVTALECVQNVVSNEILKREMNKVTEAVRGGKSLAASFRACPLFPEPVVTMVAVAEESGRVANGFRKWSQAYDRELERITKTFTTLLEPLMILVIGGMVGFMVLAMLLPVFQMNMVIN